MLLKILTFRSLFGTNCPKNSWITFPVWNQHPEEVLAPRTGNLGSADPCPVYPFLVPVLVETF